jgi:hypothetical protein
MENITKGKAVKNIDFSFDVLVIMRTPAWCILDLPNLKNCHAQR